MADETFHLSADELDLWLDDRLPLDRLSHLETCDLCRMAAEETREVVLQLRRLPKATPTVSFADRVMAQVSLGVDSEHFSPEDLDLWVAGLLPVARKPHLQRCPSCQALADAERVLVMRLEALPLFDPRPGFADAVMDRVDLPVTSFASAWRGIRGRAARQPMNVGIAASAAMLLGGSLAASAAWAAANQELITGAGTWLVGQAQQWFWQTAATVTALLEQQSWYGPARAALTPGRIAVLAGFSALVYAGGVVLLRRLLAPPAPQAARALP